MSPPSAHRPAAAVLAFLLLGGLIPGGAALLAAPLLKKRPGPIDRPLSFAATDFDRDGYPDLLVADFQAGTVTILINQKDGTFAPPSYSPIPVGIATVGQPTSGPLLLLTPDLNPDDVDGDNVKNSVDNCPNVYNPPPQTGGAQTDADNNGIGDACELWRVCDNSTTTACGADTDCPSDGTCTPTGKVCSSSATTACSTDTDCPPGDSCALADTDGDGVPDYDPSQITPGQFSPPVLDNCPRMPNPGQEDSPGGTPDRIGDVCAASPDLIILETSLGGGFTTGLVRVRLNSGAGGTVSRFSLGTGAGPLGLALGDFNADGAPDVVIANSGGDSLSLYSGKGDGQFNPMVTLTAGDDPEGLAAADFDGDGDLDLAVAERGADSVAIFVNSGTGLPTTAPVTLPTQAAPTALLAGGLDADTCVDLVVLDQGRSVCSGSTTICDSDDDCPSGGTCAPLTPGTIEVFTHAACPGDLTLLSTTTLPAGVRPRAGLLEDLDGDGILDLAVAGFDGDLVLIDKGNGDGTFSPAPPLTANLGQPVAIASLDYESGGGAPDLAVLSFASRRLDLFVNGGGLAFSPAAKTPASAWRSTSDMTIFAADASAGFDITLLQRPTGRVDVLSGIGNNFFRPLPPFFPVSITDASSMVVGDLFSDNLLDLLVADDASPSLTVVRALASGALEEGPTTALPSAAARPAVGSLLSGLDDYDRDGVADLLDNCPTRYNPPLCTIDDPTCAVTVLCTEGAGSASTCDPAPMTGPPQVDPVTMQCDSDRNGIGDQCQLSAACPGATTVTTTDTDQDGVLDYNPSALGTALGLLDFDRDSVANINDNCPTTANQNQSDANSNGVGDACETLVGGQATDSDGDGVVDFDPGTLALDNCPSRYNPGQEDNDGDRVGNACVLAAALDNCPWVSNPFQEDTLHSGIGDACSTTGGSNPTRLFFNVNDIAAPLPSAGEVDLLIGDGSGSFRPAPVPSIGGFVQPTAALIGKFTLVACATGDCLTSASDLLVADAGSPGSGDDRIQLFSGDGQGNFAPDVPVAAQGDPNQMLQVTGQPACANPYYSPSFPGPKFASESQSTVVAVLEPGTSSLGLYLPSTFGLTRPFAHPAALPVPAPLQGAVFTDLNQDGLADLVALSGGDGDPSTPNVTVFIGLGNGLLFTDPTFNPGDAPDGSTQIAAANTDLRTDPTYPDIVVFNAVDAEPVVLSNILTERADIDGSGRVDGYDLAFLASAFGARRGEDFVLQADGTLLQSGSGPMRVVVGTGTETQGQDLPQKLLVPESSPAVYTYSCDLTLQTTSPRYGLAPDINLDGLVDGTDLAILASQFSRRF